MKMPKNFIFRPMTVRKTATQRAAAACLETYNPLRGLSVQHAQQIFDAARRGNDVRLQWIYHNIEQIDPTLMICAERRAGALVDLDWTIRPKQAQRSRGFDETLAREQVAFLEGFFGAAAERGLWQAVEHLASAFFRGHAHVAPRWSVDGLTLTGFDCLDAWNVCRDSATGVWHWNPTASDTADFGSLEVIPPSEVIHLLRSRHVDYPAMAIYLRSALGESAWGRFLERYGVPPVIITMPPDIDPARVSDYCAAAEKVADGASGALPNGSGVNYATEARGTNPFKEFVQHQQELTVLMATGGLLTSLTGATGIGQGATGAHEETWRMIVRRDAGIIAEQLNRTLTDTLLNRAFPGRPHLATFDFETEPPPSAAEIFDLAAKAVQAGYKINQHDLEEKTGYRLISAHDTPGDTPISSPLTFNRATPTETVNEDKGKALKALALSLNADLTPAMKAIERFLSDPTPTAAQRLMEDLPCLLPEDPQAAIILEQAIAEAYCSAAREESDTVRNTRSQVCRAKDQRTCRYHKGKREAETPGNRDNYGTNDTEKLSSDPDKNVTRGKHVITHLLAKKEGSEDQAMYRKDTGWIGIDYGTPGNPDNAYKGGHGLAHIFAKHPEVTPESLADTLQYGECYKHDKDKNKLYLTYNDTMAILTKHRTGRLLITDFEQVSEKEKREKLSKGKYHIRGEN